MKVVVSDRNGEVPERVRVELEQRLAKLGRHFDLLIEADVVFDTDAKRSGKPLQVVDITLRSSAARLEPIRARETGRELDDVITLALDKLDGEVLKLKEQVRTDR